MFSCMVGIRPGVSANLAFVCVGAAHGVRACGGGLMASGLAIAGLAGVVGVDVPSVSPTVVGVVVAAWACAGGGTVSASGSWWAEIACC